MPAMPAYTDTKQDERSLAEGYGTGQWSEHLRWQNGQNVLLGRFRVMTSYCPLSSNLQLCFIALFFNFLNKMFMFLIKKNNLLILR